MRDELAEIRAELQTKIDAAEQRLREENRARDREMRNVVEATEERLRDSIRWTEELMRALLRGSDAAHSVVIAMLRREVRERSAAGRPEAVQARKATREGAPPPRSGSPKASGVLYRRKSSPRRS